MPLRLLLIVFLAAGLIGGNGKKQGRRGNALYEEQQYEAAADAYYAGLAAYSDGRTDGAYYGLQNNLGAALHRQGEFDMARDAFQNALTAAASPSDVARTAYNAGNNEFLGQQAEAALAHYRQALLADPTNQDAKFNYEFVKRQQQQQQQQNGEDENQDEQNQDEQNQDQQQDQQNQDQQEQEDQQNQDEQNQDEQQDQQQDQQEQEQQQQPEPQESSEQLSRQQAERILQALENEEEELLREVQKMKGRPRRVDKDW